MAKEKSKFRMATGRGWRLLVHGEMIAAGDKVYNENDNTWTEVIGQVIGKPWNGIDHKHMKRSSKVAVGATPPAQAATKPPRKPRTPKAPTVTPDAATTAKPEEFQTADEHVNPDTLNKPYQLLDVWKDANKYADMPKPLAQGKAANLSAGMYACVCFEKRGTKSERMWVRITTVEGSIYMGVLDNQPKQFDAKVIKRGANVTFAPCHVIKAVDQAGVAIE